MAKGDWFSVSDVQKTWKGYPETSAALQAAMRAGWRLREQGHGGRLYCAYEHDPMHRPHQFSVAHTPKSDGREARRIGTELRKCLGE